MGSGSASMYRAMIEQDIQNSMQRGRNVHSQNILAQAQSQQNQIHALSRAQMAQQLAPGLNSAFGAEYAAHVQQQPGGFTPTPITRSALKQWMEKEGITYDLSSQDYILPSGERLSEEEIERYFDFAPNTFGDMSVPVSKGREGPALAKNFNPYQTGRITFPTEFAEDGLVENLLVTPPDTRDDGTSTALATHPDMRIIEEDEQPPNYDLTWVNGKKMFKEIKDG